MNYRTYKRKLDLTYAQEQRLRSWIGACRVVYNLGLSIKIDAYKKAHKSINKFELMKQITDLRKDVIWINDVPADSLSNTMDRLDKSYVNFFNGSGFPKWASKRDYKSFLIRQNIHVSANKIKLQKIGWLKMFKDSPVVGLIKSVIVKQEVSGFYACIMCEVAEPKFTPANNEIGIDMGIASFATDSNGSQITNPRHFNKYERKLRIENRSLSRKKKFSNSWKRQAKRLGLIHHKIANVRKDFLHKQSTLIAKANSTVYLEDLNIKGMSKNGNLSKHILDAGWGAFRAMLEYKTNVVAIDPKYTSQTCNECGVVDGVSRFSQSQFKCTSCGHLAHADINAAKNIMSKGIAFVRQREAVACA